MRRLREHDTLWLMLGFGALYLAAACYLTFYAHIEAGDNLSRIANAYYVLFSRDPHLAAVGFVWNPLPSMLYLPLLLVLQPLHAVVFAGPATSALFSAFNVVIVRRVVRQIGVHDVPLAALVALYALNPFVLLYAANGMTEALFLTPVLLLTSAMLSWQRTHAPGPLLGAGLACALGFGMRYESVILVVAGSLAITIVWWKNWRGNFDRLEGEMIAFVVPFVYVLGLWMAANWLIMGSPFYFQSSPLSNAAQSLQLRYNGSWVTPLFHHPLPTVWYVLVRCLWFMPALPVIGLAALALQGRRRRLLDLLPLLFPGSILVFHVYMLYAGQSFGWLRFYCYTLPLGIFAAAMVVAAMPRASSRRGVTRKRLATLAVLLGVAVSVPSTGYAMAQASLGHEEYGVIALLQGRHVHQIEVFHWDAEQRMAAYLDSRHLRQGSVVLDTTGAFAMVLYSRHPKQFVIPSDPDFGSTVAQLSQFRGYVVVYSHDRARTPLLPARYAPLAAGREGWAVAQHRSGNWVLYRIRSA